MPTIDDTPFLDNSMATETLRNNLKIVGSALLSAPGRVDRISNFAMMEELRHIRDVRIWNMPILPGAVTIYQQLASHREWQVSGKLDKALRAVDYLNKTRVVSPVTGMIYEGFEDYLKRRALDFVAVGRIANYTPKTGKERFMEYLDPTHLAWVKNDRKPVRPNEKVWTYYGETTPSMRFDEVQIAHPLPIGGVDLFIAPLLYVMPTAMLSWLLYQHDTAALDGRKIRDILFVGSDQIQTAVTTAITTMVALHAGEDPSKVGIPIVAVNNMSGLPLKDQIHTLGLANIPEAFDRAKFTFDYVNQIAASLGLALRHFWNAEITTNKALEEVQEQRQQQKGPSVYTRTEERLINTSSGFDQFGTGSKRPHFSFIEEVDSASQKTNAEVLKLTTEALQSVATVFQASLSLEAMLAWMQSIRVLPNDLELVQSTSEVANQNVAPNDPPVTDAVPASNETPQPTGDAGGVSPQPQPKKPAPKSQGNEELEYGDYSVNSKGEVRERRLKIFSIGKSLQSVVEDQIQKDLKSTTFEDSLEKVESEVVNELRNLLVTKTEAVELFVKTQTIFGNDELSKVIEAALTRDNFTEAELGLVTYIVGHFDE